MAAKRSISFGEKLGMIGLILASLGNFFYALFMVRLRQGHIVGGAVSFLLRKLSLKASDGQMQWLLRPTSGTYKAWARLSRSYKPDIVEFPDGSAGCWIGRRNAPQTIVYFHGGGYYVPATLAHVKWLDHIRKYLSKNGKETSVLMLHYTLAPEAQYPAQLRQAVNLLKYAMEDEKLSPSQIIIGGDSAGGNCTLAVLSHLLHPHPEVPELKLKEPFLGTMLISPWITFEYEDLPPSGKYRYDMLSPPQMVQTGNWFLGDATRDEYNEPLKASPDWWTGLQEKTRGMYVWCGTDEMLNPSIHTISAALEKHVRLTLIVDKGATHVSTIIDGLVPGIEGVDPGTLAWLSSQFLGTSA